MNKFGCVTLILESVIKEGIAHANQALLSLIKLVPELLEPHPIIWVASLCDIVSQQLVHNIDIVDDVQDE